MSYRNSLTGVRPVDSLDECRFKNIIYVVDGVFYELIDDKLTEITPTNLSSTQLIQYLLLFNGVICPSKPEKPGFLNIYHNKDEDQWYMYINRTWIKLGKKFINDWYGNRINGSGSDDNKRDLEAVELKPKTIKEHMAEYFKKEGVWYVEQNSPKLTDDDEFPIDSFFIVNGSSINLKEDETYPKDVVEHGASSGDYLIKSKSGWLVIHMSKNQFADQIMVSKDFTLSEKLNEMEKNIFKVTEDRFKTFRGYIQNKTEVGGLALESGHYVICLSTGTIVYNESGTLKETISGLIPNFNGRYGLIKPESGDYNTTQIVDGETTLANTLSQLKSKLSDKLTFKGFVTIETEKPESPVNGDLMLVVSKFTHEDWNKDSGFKTLFPGDILIYLNGWHYISSPSNTLTSMQLKVGGLLSKVTPETVAGSLVYVDDASLTSSDLNIKDIAEKFGKGSLLIKLSENTFVNALPEVINSGLVHIDHKDLEATNLDDALTELNIKIKGKSNNVGILYITPDKPVLPIKEYEPSDYGIVRNYVKSGYIYNGNDYTLLTDVMPGTILMLNDANIWEVLWEPTKFIGVIESEEELANVEWKGPMSYVMITRDTENFRYGDCITSSGKTILETFDLMPNSGKLFCSKSLRMSLQQLDNAIANMLLVGKNFIDKLPLKGWVHDDSVFRAGDYFIAEETGKIVGTSSIIPNDLVTKGDVILFDGYCWNVLAQNVTTDFVKCDDESSLTDKLKKIVSYKIEKIVGFVDLNDKDSVEKVKCSATGEVFKVNTTSNEFPTLKRGDYINNKLEVIEFGDLSKIPCTLDKESLTMADWVKKSLIKVPMETIEDVQSKYPGITNAKCNGTIKCVYDDDGLLVSVTVLEKAEGKLFLSK